MSSWRRAIGFGVLAWLIPFVVAVVAFPLHDSARPVFESVMAVTVASTAVVLGLAYVRRIGRMMPGEGLLLGLLWLGLCILIDAPLVLSGSLLQMSLGAYLGDIGLTYLCIPVVTWGLGAAHSAALTVRSE